MKKLLLLSALAVCAYAQGVVNGSRVNVGGVDQALATYFRPMVVNGSPSSSLCNTAKAIGSSTNALPIVVTSNGHGFSNGDVVTVYGHATNTAANGTWMAGSVTTNTFALCGYWDGTTCQNPSTGNGVGGATGFISKQVGRVAFRNDATAGQNLYYCTDATGSPAWQQQLNSGSGIDANAVKNAIYCPDTSGAANTITCLTTTGFPVAYAAGQFVIVKMANTVTGAATININSLGAKAVTKNGTTALANNDLLANGVYAMTYDGAGFVVTQNLGSGGAGTPGGSSGDIQVNNSGAFGAATVNQLQAPQSCQAAGASGTAYTCSVSPAIVAYVTGGKYRFKADVANTGADPNVNFNSIGAITIKKIQGGITTALVANDIRAGQWVDLTYDGANMQMTSQLGNVPTATQSYTFAGVALPNAIFKSIQGSNLATGDTDLYTCPTSKRCLIGGETVFNASGGNIASFFEIKVSGTYYRLMTTPTTLGMGGSAQAGVQIVLEAGEIIAVNTATNAGLNVRLSEVEFDNTASLKTVKLLGLSTGANTLYTVTTGKSAAILGASGFPGNNNTNNLAGVINCVADSGGTRTFTPYVIPSGGSQVLANQMGLITATTASNRTQFSINATLASQDFVNINVDTGNAAQICYANVTEF